MKLIMRLVGVGLALFFSSSLIGAQQDKHPATYLDKGACPFECCTYRRWKTEKSTVAYARPNRNSRIVGRFKAGSRVVGLTGRVITTAPGRLKIIKDHGKYKRGDVLWVYTPLGEGYYKVWFKGKLYEEGLDYLSGPYEQSIPTCEQRADCWAKLETELKTVWWVRVKSANGWVGWTDKPENFSDKDACG